MTTITPPILEQYGFEQGAEPKFAKELGQAEFLKLMMAQLENQDPMKPMDNGEFLGQMAQFSTVSGIEDMQKSMDNLSTTYATSQTLQSTALVGQEVLIESDNLELNSDESVTGSFELDSSSGDIKLDIADAAGVVVRQIDLGEFSAGRHAFVWDGKNNNGEKMPAGKYTATVTAQRDEGYEALTVLTSRVIDSVEFSAGSQPSLNTVQGDVLTMADIRQIRNAVQNRNNQ